MALMVLWSVVLLPFYLKLKKKKSYVSVLFKQCPCTSGRSQALRQSGIQNKITSSLPPVPNQRNHATQGGCSDTTLQLPCMVILSASLAYVSEEAVCEPHSTPAWRPDIQSQAWIRWCTMMYPASLLVSLASEGNFIEES